MKKRMQLIILWLGIIIIVAMCLFPPFVADSGSSVPLDVSDSIEKFEWEFPKKVRGSRGYDYLFSDNIRVVEQSFYKVEGKYYGDEHRVTVPAHIDFVRLIIQCAIAGLVTVGLVYTLNDKKAERGGK